MYAFTASGFLIFALGLCRFLHGETQAQETSESQIIEQTQNLISAGQVSEADRVLRKAIQLYPRSGGLYNLLGIAAAEQKNEAQAEAAFTEALKCSPTLTPAMLNLGRVLHGEGKRSTAIAVYRRALRLDNNLEEAHANLAALLLDEGDYAGAERELEALPASDRKQNRFVAMDCAALAGMGKLDRARQAAGQMTASSSAQDVSLAAYALTKLNQSALVIAMLEPVVRNGASGDLQGLLATAYGRSGNLAQARSAFESLARADPMSTQPLVDAAKVAYQQKDYEGAAGYLTRAIAIQPGDANAQFFFGIVCLSLKLPGDAVRALREAVRLAPDNAPFNYALGAAILAGDRSSSAVECFKKYVRLRPTDPHGHLALAVAEFEEGKSEAAQREASPLTTTSGVAAGAHYILAKICRQQNDLDGAVKHFAEATRLDPDDAALQANLAGVYIRQNRLSEAREVLKRALALDSENYLVNENYLLLLRKEKDPQAEQQAQRFAAVTQKASEDQQLLLRHIEMQ
jgi:Flp pilus assembly protein TadD